MILLNCVIQSQEDIVAEIPQQRLIFFVKHIDDVLREIELSHPVKTEIVKALTISLPLIKDVYGSFWATIVEFTQNTLSVTHTPRDDEVAFLHASLRLLMTLYQLSTQGSNDDLEYAFNESQQPIAGGLLSLLSQLQCASLDFSNTCSFC